MKAAIIVWKDIVYKTGWNTAKEYDDWVTKDKHNVVNQLAYILEDDEDQLVVVDSYFEDKSAYGTIHKIPKGCIISVTEITL